MILIKRTILGLFFLTLFFFFSSLSLSNYSIPRFFPFFSLNNCLSLFFFCFFFFCSSQILLSLNRISYQNPESYFSIFSCVLQDFILSFHALFTSHYAHHTHSSSSLHFPISLRKPFSYLDPSPYAAAILFYSLSCIVCIARASRLARRIHGSHIIEWKALLESR